MGLSSPSRNAAGGRGSPVCQPGLDGSVVSCPRHTVPRPSQNLDLATVIFLQCSQQGSQHPAPSAVHLGPVQPGGFPPLLMPSTPTVPSLTLPHHGALGLGSMCSQATCSSRGGDQPDTHREAPTRPGPHERDALPDPKEATGAKGPQSSDVVPGDSVAGVQVWSHGSLSKDAVSHSIDSQESLKEPLIYRPFCSFFQNGSFLICSL